MDEFIKEVLDGLSTAGVLFYIWWYTNNIHLKEREQWRAELKNMSEVLAAVTQQVNQLSIIIEHYVIGDGKNPAGRPDRKTGAR